MASWFSSCEPNWKLRLVGHLCNYPFGYNIRCNSVNSTTHVPFDHRLNRQSPEMALRRRHDLLDNGLVPRWAPGSLSSTRIYRLYVSWVRPGTRMLTQYPPRRSKLVPFGSLMVTTVLEILGWVCVTVLLGCDHPQLSHSCNSEVFVIFESWMPPRPAPSKTDQQFWLAGWVPRARRRFPGSCTTKDVWCCFSWVGFLLIM